MKRIFTLLTIGALLSSFTFFSSIDEVITAMKAGNAADIARFFDNTNTVKGFTLDHKGENSGSQYCIGTLLTKNATYRTTVFMKLKGDKQLLQTITFERK